jgi:8-oxo-dGTP pyrophosphatase MutT (NUDIX family)
MILQNLLSQYAPFDEIETAMAAHFTRFLERWSTPAFAHGLAGDEAERGHVTGSAWIVNHDGSKVVLLHHAKLGIWVQPGGHCDGETDVAQVALREAREETGLEVSLLDEAIFDVDVHRIPEYWNTPEHFHFDIRFGNA